MRKFQIQNMTQKSKTPLTEHADEFILSLKREVNFLAQVNHPYVLKFIGYSPIDFLHSNRPVINTEYLTNGSLYDIVRREKNNCILESWTPTKKLINIFGIASIMEFSHKINIIQRDLKLDNVLFDEYLFQKIADFGYSKDTRSVYYHCSKIDHSHSDTFRSLGDGYAVDTRSAYYCGSKIYHSHSETFRLLGGGYAKDTRNTYYLEKKKYK